MSDKRDDRSDEDERPDALSVDDYPEGVPYEDRPERFEAPTDDGEHRSDASGAEDGASEEADDRE